MSIRVLEIVFRANIEGRMKQALIGVANYTDDNGDCFPSSDALADDLGRSRDTVRCGLHEAVGGAWGPLFRVPVWNRCVTLAVPPGAGSAFVMQAGLRSLGELPPASGSRCTRGRRR
jgi:hypothetical protein